MFSFWIYTLAIIIFGVEMAWGVLDWSWAFKMGLLSAYLSTLWLFLILDAEESK